MVNELDYAGINFPVPVSQCCRIEVQNDVNVNIFGYENKNFYPVRVSNKENEKEFNLLLLTEGEKNIMY